ncbi:MAG: hypothetical protein K2Y37_20895 [Pirellulales bacterium]|nr:hypothetical protein [Pirellulales bacterium]
MSVAGNAKRRRNKMSDNTHTNEKTGSKTPSHIAYQVRDRGDNKKSFWTRIGVAFEHADKNIQLDGLVPLDGRITLRVDSEKKE